MTDPLKHQDITKLSHAAAKATRSTVSLCCLLLASLITEVHAYTPQELMDAAVQVHPSIKAADQSIDAASKGVDAAKGLYWPTLSATLEASSDKRNAIPARYLRLEQSLWDGGYTAATVSAADAQVSVAWAQKEQQIHQLRLQVVEAWQKAHVALGRVSVAELHARRLNEHEAMMARRIQAEASTAVEMQLIRSQSLQAVIERKRAKTSFALAVKKLSQLTGKSDIDAALQKSSVEPPAASAEERQQLLALNWLSIVKSQAPVVVAQAQVEQGFKQLEQKRKEAGPQVFARLERGIGSDATSNGFVGVRYSFNAGGAQASNVAAVEAKVGALQSEADSIRLEVQDLIERDLGELNESSLRHENLSLAVQSSREIYESYVRQFVAGRKSWLDVMNALGTVASNEYALNESLITYAAALLRLKLYVAAAPQR